MPATRSKTNDIREQIIAAATRLFARKGFDGAALQDIADEVGIRKPSLLYHVSSKSALRLEVIEHIVSRWNEVLPRLLMAATSGDEQFQAVVSEVVQFFTDDPDRARVLIREVLDRPDEVVSLLSTHIAPWLEVVCGHIRRGQQQGHIRAGIDPEAYVVHVIFLVLSSVSTGDCFGSFVSSERQIHELLRIARSSLFVTEHADRQSVSGGRR